MPGIIGNKMTICRLILAAFAITVLIALFGCSNQKTKSTMPPTHPAEWINPDSEDFHGHIVNSRGFKSCQVCHGIDLNGGQSHISCIECHLESNVCNACHGGYDNKSGAPPYGLHGEISDTALAVGAHTAHIDSSSISGSVPCQTCHLVPLVILDEAHFDTSSAILDSIAEITWQGLETDGSAVWDRQLRECSKTYCHGNFYGGDTTNVPIWTATDQAVCGSCHDIGDDPALLLGAHKFHVDIMSFNCSQCHGSVVDDGLNITVASLHVNGIINTAITNPEICERCHGPNASPCSGCHGGLDNDTGAPPYDLRGDSANTLLGVGAHTAHLTDSPLAAALECGTCHIVPDDIIDSLHLDLGTESIDSIAEITWSGLADNGESIWDRNAAECSNSYCHGNFIGGNVANTPVWTAVNQAECGTCHDDGSAPLNLSSVHYFHVGTAAIRCSLCHSEVIDNQKEIVSNQLHVNGIKNWDENSCDDCHEPSGSRCVICHGGLDNQSGAPPYDIDGESAASLISVGAHTAHIDGNLISDGIDCDECHVVPVFALAVGHLDSDGIPDIDFGPLAGSSSTWNRNTRLCSDSYCHGNFSGGYFNNTPDWTGGEVEAGCGSCHDDGTNPRNLSGRHDDHVAEGIECYRCHASTVNVNMSITGLGQHVNGSIEIVFSSGSGTFSGGRCNNVGCHDSEDW
ncbi:MAG: CxxxxCH/CxxCH domain-containing protein [Candidatus Zixiibacteriota bacterium]